MDGKQPCLIAHPQAQSGSVLDPDLGHAVRDHKGRVGGGAVELGLGSAEAVGACRVGAVREGDRGAAETFRYQGIAETFRDRGIAETFRGPWKRVSLRGVEDREGTGLWEGELGAVGRRDITHYNDSLLAPPGQPFQPSAQA